MSTEVVMPQMGESIAEGTITKWMKNVGDHVDRDEPLFEISTDKVDAEIPSPAAGILTEIRFKEGETVEVNTVVAMLDGEGGQPAAQPEAASTEKETAPTKTEAPPESSKVEAPAAVEQPKPIATTSEHGAPAATAPPAHKTEVKPLVKKTETTTPAPTHRDDESATSAEELRRTKSSPLVRKIAKEHSIDISQASKEPG
jgi:2-oxoglutarate dehydrogenase E2 component (dihydrolipoamide succinyltransferase)